jgi:CubicO group peptidase (beta-lactamase class C family)
MKPSKAIRSALDYVPAYLSFQQSYKPFVGAQVAVRRKGKLLLNHAVGYADLANETPLTVDHLFRIASHSKTFTAVACMQLAEQGKLRLDDPASAHAPQVADMPMGSVTV